MTTKPEYAFFDGRIVPIDQAKISVMTQAFNYGTGVFGGMRGYWNADEDQLFVFRAHDHFERLIQSAKMMRIGIEQTPQQLTDILTELLRQEGYRENVYIRPQAYKSQLGIGVRLHDMSDGLTIWTIPAGSYLPTETDLHVCFSAWRRVDDNSIPARGKVSGAYANSALIKTDAVLAGYDEALVLNNDGHISEASAANFFMIRKGVLITPPVHSNVLEGIIRRSIMQMARDEFGIETVEREIDRTELYIADEAFLCGTGVQLAAITKVEHRPIGEGVIGPITTKLRDLFFKVMTGRAPAYRDWLTPVYVPESVK